MFEGFKKEEKKRKRRIATIAISIVIVLLILIIIFAITRNSNSSTKLSAADVVANAENILGAEVNYEVKTEFSTDITWRVFYADNDNIYLIASDCILVEDAPSTESGLTPIDEDSESTYDLYLYNVYSEFTGSANWDKELSVWNNTYLSNYSNSEYNNAKAVEYLLDTDLWDSFAKSKYADYAIGGPTLELWVASWNQHGYDALYCDTVNEYGYYISDVSEVEEEYYNVTWLDNSGYGDTLYFPLVDEAESSSDLDTFIGNLWAYWLASPSASYEDTLMGIYYNGYIDWAIYDNDGYGYRPVVCLSSRTKLQSNEDGTYSLTK